MHSRFTPAVIACLGALASLLVGCSTSTEVSLTGYTPGQYSHVWITTQEVWFNTSATAGPDDGGWAKYKLKTPTTIDLVAQNGGNLSSITSGLRLVTGTYSQVRLIPVDPSLALTSSAQSAGAKYNSEADYIDSSGTTHQLPLELLNPDKGIGIATSLKVPVGNVAGSLKSVTAGLGGGTSTSTMTGNPLGIGSTASTSSTTSSTSASSSSTTQNSFVVSVDGNVDLVPFAYAPSATGVMLSSHAAAYDLARSGGISGQLTLTNITSATSGLPAIQVSAETLSADGMRHIVVSTTSVQADGSFLLYPLGADTNGVDYDVVIHGPGIATIIIKAVQVILPGSSTTLGNSGSNTTTNSSTTNTTTSATTGTSSTANNVVAIGTLTPRAAEPPPSTGFYTATLSISPGTSVPAGAQVQFCQTIARQGEVPYVIEASAIDPFNPGKALFNGQQLSTGTVDSGTWSVSGGTVKLASAAPSETAGTYLVAATAPGYGDGALTAQVSGSAGATSPVNGLQGLNPSSGSVAGTLTAVVSQSTAGKYDAGELLVSYNGTLVATGALDPAFTGANPIIRVTGLPAESPTALYDLTVRAWSSSDPAGTLQRQWYPTPVDFRQSASGLIQLSVN